MKRAVLLALLLCAGITSLGAAQTADTLPRRPSQAPEIAGGILGSAAGLVAGAAVGFGTEVSAGCIDGGGCGGAAFAGAVVGGVLGAAGGAYLGGRLARHDVSFPRALGGASLGVLIYVGAAAALSSADDSVTVPFLISIPLGQGLLAGLTAQRPRRD